MKQEIKPGNKLYTGHRLNEGTRMLISLSAMPGKPKPGRKKIKGQKTTTI